MDCTSVECAVAAAECVVAVVVAAEEVAAVVIVAAAVIAVAAAIAVADCVAIVAEVAAAVANDAAAVVVVAAVAIAEAFVGQFVEDCSGPSAFLDTILGSDVPDEGSESNVSSTVATLPIEVETDRWQFYRNGTSCHCLRLVRDLCVMPLERT